MSAIRVELPADSVTAIPSNHKYAGRSNLYLIAGVVLLVASYGLDIVLGDGKGGFFFSYLTAFMYFLSLALGGLFFVIVQFLAKAGWSVVVRRTAENLMATLPWMAILFIPVVIGAHTTHHHWMGHDGTDPVLVHKSPWLNEPRWYIFAALYFLLWTGLALFYRKKSVEQDRTGDQQLTRQMQKMAGPALAIFALSLTFAAIDWVMSMDPHWYSTMFGVYYFAGAVLGCFAVMIILLQNMQRAGLLNRVVNQEHYHDLGKLLFGFVVFWTYIAFCQYFLIWYANIPEETLWYQHRLDGNWKTIAIFIMIGHFFLPFFYLLPRGQKRDKSRLYVGAAWLLMIHYIDLYWVIMPLHSHDFHPSLVDLTTFLGVAGVFMSFYSRYAAKDALIPLKDPRLPESLAFENF